MGVKPLARLGERVFRVGHGSRDAPMSVARPARSRLVAGSSPAGHGSVVSGAAGSVRFGAGAEYCDFCF